MSISVHSLHIYPIKSCQGISVKSAELTETGFKYDRHWMLVDKQGNFLTQREYPQMALIKTELSEETLIAKSPYSQIKIPLQSDDAERVKVNIWRDECSAARVSEKCSTWFSEFLGVECELVFLPSNEQRKVDPEFTSTKQQVGFADGFPLLLLSQASIDLLNQKLLENIDINRFRANIIVDGCIAHAEDDWTALIVNDIQIDLPKRCSRCAIPSINQTTAEKNPEILTTLAKYRRSENNVYFGQNGVHLSQGNISCGQLVKPIN